MTDDRGQAFTLEGIVSGVIVLTALLLALQTVSIAPATTGSTDSAAALRTQANDLLAVADDQGYLERIVLCGKEWDGTSGVSGTDVSPYRAIGNDKLDKGPSDPGGPLTQSATPLGDMIRVAFTNREYNFRLEFAYLTGPNTREVMSVFPRGADPTDNPRPAARDPAIVATRTITLFDDMETTGITDPTRGSGDRPTQKFCTAGMPGEPSGVPLSDVAKNTGTSNAEFYLPDVDTGSDLFNIVEVRLVVW